MNRPDLSQIPADVRTYIEFLEAELQTKRAGRRADAPVAPGEPPTTWQLVTVSQQGVAKRTPRHLYSRQRRGGMGVFDLDVAQPDYPALLAVADQAAYLLLFSNLGRAYRLPVSTLAETDGRGKGEALANHLNFQPNEQLVSILPADAGQYVILVSQRGWVQRVRSSYFGRSLFAGMSFHDPKQGGFVTAGCWTNGAEQLFIGTRQGKGIRFRETQVPARGGCLGLRVDQGDVTVAVTAVTDTSTVFLLSSDGKGTIREMSGFRMNKSPGAGPKVALKTDDMVAAAAVKPEDDLFIISQSGKIIRFPAAEIPAKEGVVQGVNCMSLRNDKVTAAAAVGD